MNKFGVVTAVIIMILAIMQLPRLQNSKQPICMIEPWKCQPTKLPRPLPTQGGNCKIEPWLCGNPRR